MNEEIKNFLNKTKTYKLKLHDITIIKNIKKKQNRKHTTESNLTRNYGKRTFFQILLMFIK